MNYPKPEILTRSVPKIPKYSFVPEYTGIIVPLDLYSNPGNNISLDMGMFNNNKNTLWERVKFRILMVLAVIVMIVLAPTIIRMINKRR
jgi:hypothetical protein